MKNVENVTFFKKNKKINSSLSVIVPMYNAEKWIKRCIGSILGQTFHDLEVIIINDGSTDNSLNIVEDLCKEDGRIRCISTRNQGSAMAKNVGLKYVSGDIITFVDADDFIEAEMYRTMLSILDNTGADIVECACRRINQYGRKLDDINLVNEEIDGSEKCLVHFMEQKNTKNYMCNKIYRRKLFKDIRFPFLYFSEDYYMNAILHSKINKKIVLSQIFYNYMIYPGQSTDRKKIDIKRIDGIKAGNMVADYFFYSKNLKNYAGLYACKYALFIVDVMYRNDHKEVKKFIKQMRRELSKTLLNISFDLLHDKNEKGIVFQCFIMLISNRLFFDLKWLFE